MRSSIAIIISGLAALAAAYPSATAPREPGKFGCNTKATEAYKKTLVDVAALEESASFLAEANSSIAAAPIQTWFHVVGATNAQLTAFTDKMISDQLAVMNKDFAPAGFSFTKAGTTRTVNSGWSNDGNELAMKKQLRKGDYKTLNLYFLRYLDDAFGYCYFPQKVSGTTSQQFTLDGCSILYSTVPGGSYTGYNLGKTVVHEVGHWFGLLHTFEGGCTGSGDMISDTPAQASSTSGCPTGRDSCPNQAGLDPIHNYMDYSTDICYTEFTAGQITRMNTQFNTYRA